MISRRRALALLPVLIFVGLAAALWMGLSHDPKYIPSVLVGKPAPAFDLPAVKTLNVPGLATADLKKGSVSIVNIWASWCIPCRQEQPILLELSKRKDISVFGINNKDDPENAAKFLETMGNPFAAIGADPQGRATIDWGAYGVPETFIVDGNGIIRYKVIGGLTPDMLLNLLPSEIAKAQKPLP